VDAHSSADLDLRDDIADDAAAIVAAVRPPAERPPPGAPGSTSIVPPRAPSPLDSADDLTDDQRAILDFERTWWRQPGAKEQAIRDNFEMSPTRYYQTLNGILDLPQALLYDPTLVHRLIRMRSGATRARRLR
jgi:hypothetical protein